MIVMWQYLFILLQDYELDGVDSTRVDFEDNQECLDVFEKVFQCLHP